MPSAAPPGAFDVSFSHVHIYCDSLRTVDEYRKLEAKMNDFAAALARAKLCDSTGTVEDKPSGREQWLSLEARHSDVKVGTADPAAYRAVGQDVVEQILVGLGWRVTGSCDSSGTRSLVLQSKDLSGVKFVVTAPLADAEEPSAKRHKQEVSDFAHFDVERVTDFFRHHHGRQGVASLGFTVARGNIEIIHGKYAELHPTLLVPGGRRKVGGAEVLEVYAYYKGEVRESEADLGTMIRFVEEESADLHVLPGITRLEATFEEFSQPAYCDHWVSNVFSRTGFLQTLQETLGFTPKVDFNAGVVAAGEAQIESTVTGNSPDLTMSDKLAALKNQNQIYLPINNALSEVGHVHVFLQELGQGIQHIASRVADLGSLIQRANDYRIMTGAGLSFLQIPRSYYGFLTAKRLIQEGLSEDAAQRCLTTLREANIVDSRDVVAFESTPAQVAAALPKDLVTDHLVSIVLRARYGNLYSLLREHVNEESYLRMVRNNILVDIQGQDLLLQIFTSKVLQRQDGEEAPFLEFIERVCSDCLDSKGCPKPIKPGCGGFGIRNFLTLFLSIEVSKAATARTEAELRGDAKAAELEARRVDAFTCQLDESNPVLTAISDAMTLEGEALEQGDTEEAQKFCLEKMKGQEALKCISNRYKEMMRKLREEQLQLSS